MNKDAIIRLVNEQMWPKTDADVPSFKAGDTITVTYKIVEGSKERLQSFRGVVIQIKGQGKTKMFTIRKISNGVGVERIFPLYSPHIEKIEVNKIGGSPRPHLLPAQPHGQEGPHQGEAHDFVVGEIVSRCNRKTDAANAASVFILGCMRRRLSFFGAPVRLYFLRTA